MKEVLFSSALMFEHKLLHSGWSWCRWSSWTPLWRISIQLTITSWSEVDPGKMSGVPNDKKKDNPDCRKCVNIPQYLEKTCSLSPGRNKKTTSPAVKFSKHDGCSTVICSHFSNSVSFKRVIYICCDLWPLERQRFIHKAWTYRWHGWLRHLKSWFQRKNIFQNNLWILEQTRLDGVGKAVCIVLWLFIRQEENGVFTDILQPNKRSWAFFSW